MEHTLETSEVKKEGIISLLQSNGFRGISFRTLVKGYVSVMQGVEVQSNSICLAKDVEAVKSILSGLSVKVYGNYNTETIYIDPVNN